MLAAHSSQMSLSIALCPPVKMLEIALRAMGQNRSSHGSDRLFLNWIVYPVRPTGVMGALQALLEQPADSGSDRGFCNGLVSAKPRDLMGFCSDEEVCHER